MKSTLKPMVALVTVLLLGGALAGCTDSEASPPETPSSSTSAPSSPPTTAKPTERVIDEPTMPERADQPGRSGAVAHARYFLNLLNYAKSTGAVEPLRDAFSSCAGCDHYADEYQRLYENGGWYEGSLWKPTAATAYAAPSGGFFVFLNVSAQRGRYMEDAQAVTQLYKPAHYELRFHVIRQAGAWQITEMMDASS